MNLDQLNACKVFKSSIQGLALVPRRPNDPHICFVYLMEDSDDQWYVNQGGAASIFFLSEMQDLVKEALEWCQKHAKPEIYRGKQTGWMFKPQHMVRANSRPNVPNVVNGFQVGDRVRILPNKNGKKDEGDNQIVTIKRVIEKPPLAYADIKLEDGSSFEMLYSLEIGDTCLEKL